MIKRRSVVTGLAALPLAGFAANLLGQAALAQEDAMPDTIATNDGDLTIHPVDHSSLVLEWKDKVIYVDPVGDAALYEGLPAATAVLITHGHGDHFDVPTLEAIAANVPLVTNQDVFDKLPEALKANATAMANGEEGTILDLPLRAIAAHNITDDRMNYHPVGVGNGYVISFADKDVYIAGDTEPTDDMLALSGIAVAFLPMNLPYTMTPEQALEAINTFKPAVVYPYHYGDSDLSPLETGLEEGIELRLRNWYPNGQG